MSIQDILKIHLRKAATPGKDYTAKDVDSIVKTWRGQSDGGLRLLGAITGTQVDTTGFLTKAEALALYYPLNSNPAGYLTTSGAETDPVFTASDAFGISAADITNWDTAFGWGDHAGLYQLLDSDLTSWAAVTRASGFDTFTATPSSANLAALLTDETGTGAAVFANAPTLVNPVVGTQAANDNSTKAASTAYVDAKKDYGLLINTALGSVILAQSIRVNEINNNNALADGQVQFFAVYLPVAATLTGVKFYQRIQGNYTSDNYNGIGLYSYSGGTLTLVASSTDDGNIWKGTASSWQTKAFTATYAASAGVYFIAYLYNSSVQVTAPTLGSQTNLTSAAGVTLDYTNSAKLMSSLAGQTALPASQASSGLTSSTVMYYGGLY